MSEPLEIAENWVHQVWQRGDMHYAKSLCAENYTDYTVPDSPEGDCAAFRQAVLDLRTAFPDLQARVEDSFQDQDFVILRISFSGTHENEFQGFAPTRERVEWESIDILHFRDDLLIERFAQDGLLEALEYAGVDDDFGGRQREAEPAEPDAQTSAEDDRVEDDFGELQSETERTQLIARLADDPRQVREAIRVSGIRPAHVGQWSTAAHVGHLWRAERVVWQARLQQVASEENPYWEGWEPDNADSEIEFGGTDVNILLDAFDFLRAETCRYLNGLTEAEWAKRGTHRDDGELDVAGLLQKAIDHDQEHLVYLTGAQL